MSCLGVANTTAVVHLVAEEPNVKLENRGLLTIDLDVPEDGTVQRVLQIRRVDVRLLGCGDRPTTTGGTIKKSRSPIHVASVPDTHNTSHSLLLDMLLEAGQIAIL